MKVTRRFTRAEHDPYESIEFVERSSEIRNPDGLQKGAVRLVVDGQPVAGNLVPIFANGRTHTVVATLG